MLHGHVEHVAMKKPRLLSIQWEDHLVDDFEVARFKAFETAEHLVVIAGDVVNGFLAGNHAEEFSHHLHVGRREVLFLELPNVDDVPVQHENLRVNRLQVAQHFGCPASAHAQMQVGNHGHFDGPFQQGLFLESHRSRCEGLFASSATVQFQSVKAALILLHILDPAGQKPNTLNPDLV